MDRLDAMRLFVRVAESGSFSAVAREQNVSQPTVSKQIAGLEAHLGAQLLRRTSRSLSLTDAGQDFYEAAVRLVDDLDAAESRVGRRQASPAGLVRATVAPVFGRLHIVSRLPEFFARYPDITVELIIADRVLNLIEDGIDVAIHNGPLDDSTLIVRKIAQTPIVTVATPAYLAAQGTPASPSDLERHALVVYAPGGAPRAWRFQGKFGSITIQPKGPFRTNDADQIHAAVLADLGLAHTPGWLFSRELAAGTVVRVLGEYEPEDLPISAVHAGGRRVPGKVRAFIEFVAGMLAEEASLAMRSGGQVPAAEAGKASRHPSGQLER